MGDTWVSLGRSSPEWTKVMCGWEQERSKGWMEEENTERDYWEGEPLGFRQKSGAKETSRNLKG